MASPRTDAELLAAYALGISRGRLLLADDFTDAQLATFRELIARRVRRVPLQHLTGTVPFGDIDLAVGPGAFIPRPETELLVAWALPKVPSGAPIVVDFCSGTGAIALSVAHAFSKATVIAVERDASAALWLRHNAADRAALGDRPIDVQLGDVTSPQILESHNRIVDMLLCNPPYVPDGTPVPTEVLHDPNLAVFGGPDGLDVIRPVISRAVTLLRPGGWFAIEHDDTQDEAVPALITATEAFDAIDLHRDLAGRPRFTTARRRLVEEADAPGWQTGSP